MNVPTSLYAAKEMLRVKAAGNEFVTLVHNATNEDPWGPTGQQMDEVTNAFRRGGSEIMDELKLRLRHRDKSFRPAYKSLLLLDHLARNVYESGLPEICALVPMLREIQNSFYHTSKGIDHGIAVRERAKKVADLLSDALLLREEREKARRTREKIEGVGGSLSSSHMSGADYGRYCGYGNTTSASGRYGGGDYSNATAATKSARYTGFGSQDVAPRGVYDPYVGIKSTTSTTQVPRTKEEQEQMDMELALKIQQEEEQRSGISAAQVAMQYERKHGLAAYRSQEDADLAYRLQKEQEERHARGRASEPTATLARNPATQQPRERDPLPSSQPSPQLVVQEERQQMKPVVQVAPQANLLDDLFSAPALPPAPQYHQELPSHTVASGVGVLPISTAPSQTNDPFDAFLDSRLPQGNFSAQPPLMPPPMTTGYAGGMMQPQTAPSLYPSPAGGAAYSGYPISMQQPQQHQSYPPQHQQQSVYGNANAPPITPQGNVDFFGGGGTTPSTAPTFSKPTTVMGSHAAPSAQQVTLSTDTMFEEQMRRFAGGVSGPRWGQQPLQHQAPPLYQPQPSIDATLSHGRQF